jgi:hydrogenase maturation protease
LTIGKRNRSNTLSSVIASNSMNNMARYSAGRLFWLYYSVRTLILGMGNLLCSDDGVGMHIIEALRKEDLGPGVDLREGLIGLDILEKIKDFDRIIIVDAIKAGGEPGNIYKFTLEDFKDKHTLHSFSTHLNMDIPTMLELGERLFPGKTTSDIKIVAVEAEDIETISDRCTPKVEKAIPEAVEVIKTMIYSL